MHIQNDMRWFERARDLDDVKRIWREVGWVEDADDELAMEDFFSVGSTLTGVIDEEAECSVHLTPGTMVLDATALPLSAVTAVTTSRVGRKRRFAQRLTAVQLACAAEEGAALSALGMFEQGFYNRVGFGNGAYENLFVIDPATLTVDATARTPIRLEVDDYRAMHRALSTRQRGNGGCVLSPPEIVRAELAWGENGFGLGYENDDEELTHFIWCTTSSVEHGPYELSFIAYQNTEQLMELLALLKSLGDQINALEMAEPPELKLQDFLQQPFKNRRMSKGSKFQLGHRAIAWWQLRILDVETCVAALRAVAPVRFNLSLTDPAAALTQGAWAGAGGDYVCDLGSESVAERAAASASLPTLETSVNAFSRLLFGVATATNLAQSEDFSAPGELVQALDEAIRLPKPHTGWEF